jgi:HEAT repeat protein
MGLFTKNYTMETLNYAKERKDKRAIIEHLNSTDDKVKIFALHELGPGDGAAIDRILGLLDSPNMMLARGSADTLGRIKDRSAADPLLKKISACKSYMVHEIAKALVSIGDYRAVEPLINRLKSDGADYFVFLALVEFGDRNALDAMEGFLRANELNKEATIVGYQLNPDTFKDFITDLAEFEKGMDDLVKNVFNGIAKTKKLPELALFYEYSRSKDGVLQRAAYSVNSNDPGTVEYYIAQLKNKDADVRQYAVYMLRKFGDIRAIEPLMDLLKDENIEVRNAAAGALKKFNVQAIPREREIIREIVKIPCKYCGTLVENTAQKCPSCGAPLNPFN